MVYLPPEPTLFTMLIFSRYLFLLDVPVGNVLRSPVVILCMHVQQSSVPPLSFHDVTLRSLCCGPFITRRRASPNRTQHNTTHQFYICVCRFHSFVILYLLMVGDGDGDGDHAGGDGGVDDALGF